MTHILTDTGYYKQQQQSLKMPVSDPYSQFNKYSETSNMIDNLNRRLITEDTMIEILKNNNIKQQIDVLDELMHRMQQPDGIIFIQKLEELVNSIRGLLLNTLNNELQIQCLKCILTLHKSIEKIKTRKENANILLQIDKILSQNLMPALIPLCGSTKVQVRQYSIDSIYLYMKQTSSPNQLYAQFIRFGIDNPDLLTSKGFIESMNNFLTDEFRYEDYSEIVKALVKHLVETTLEKSCMKTLRRIEILVQEETFNSYLNKLSPNLKNFYLNLKRQENSNLSNNNTQQPQSNRNSFSLNAPTNGGGGTSKRTSFSEAHTKMEDDFDDDENEEVDDQNNLKFNIISNKTLKKLFGEDEIQRLQAIEQLEISIKNLNDVSIVHPYYEDFIMFMSNFIDNDNYKVRVGALEILYSFVKKLKSSVESCAKVICNCARQVMSQTHQSKTMKQLIMNILLFSIENMKNPNLMFDSLLDKIKDKSAKAREECLNVIMAALIKYGAYKFDLVLTFRKVAPLLFDIKRNVRHAALECVNVIYSKMKDRDRNIDRLFSDLQNSIDDATLNTIKSVVEYRVSRGQYATLNTDMTIEYAIKMPSSTNQNTSFMGMSEPDIDWIISASATNSANVSARQNSQPQQQQQNNHHQLSQNGFNTDYESRLLTPQQIFKRKPSANLTKRLPWEEAQSQMQQQQQQSNSFSTTVPKVTRSREVAPLKAFPLYGGEDSNSNNNLNNNSNNDFMNTSWSYRAGYPGSISYQDKYLKRMQSINFQKPNDLQDITNTNQALQNGNNYKAHSYDNLQYIEDEKKKQQIQTNNGIIPSKPTIARRNSGNRNTPTHEFQNNNFDVTNMQQQQQQQQQTYSNDDLNLINSQVNDTHNENRKYGTMPNIRTSAKSRKQLNKLFSLNQNSNTITNNNNDNYIVNNNNNNNKTSKSKENEILSNFNTARPYSPEHHSESGVFSLSDYDHSIQNNHNELFTKRTNHFSSNDSDYSSNHNPNELPFNTKPKLLRSNSKPKLNTPPTPPNNTNIISSNGNLSNSKTNINNIESKPITTTTTVMKPPNQNNVEIVGKKLMSNNNSNSNSSNQLLPPPPTTSLSIPIQQTLQIPLQQQQQQPQSNTSSNSDVTKKKVAALRSLNNYAINDAANNDDDDSSLDIVGKGLFYPNFTDANGNSSSNNSFNPIDVDQNDQLAQQNEENDFPLSLSFQSRLRQKTQEKIEEKQRKKIDKINKKYKQQVLQQQNEALHNAELNSAENQFKTSDFGLSISGYNNNNSKQQNNNNLDDSLEDNNDNTNTNMIHSHRNSLNNNNNNQLTNDIDDDDLAFVLTGSYSSNNAIFPLLDQTVKHRPPKSSNNPNTDAKKPPKFVPRSKSLQRTANNSETSNPVSTKQSDESDPGSFYGPPKDDYVKQPFKSPDAALKDALALLSQDEWEKKCHAMNIIKRISVYHEEIAVSNIHAIVVALLQEVKNLRSQVSRFALSTFSELFSNLKKYMDIDLDIAVKAILQKNGESSDFIRSDVEKCLETMVNNVTPHKALAALINGGASHRNPMTRKTAAQFIYKCCEIMGPGKILSGIKDVTERVLVTASQFVVDGPPDIRWYGRKIFHMLMPYDEFDRMLNKYLNDSTRKNIKEILDSIRVKGPGEVPSESARVSRKSVRNGLTRDPISKSAGSSNNQQSPFQYTRFDQQTQEDIKTMSTQLRSQDFRERIDAIEKFQILCETETDIAITNIVSIFDRFNPCLNDSNSKVNNKALSTMLQITPLLGDSLSAVISNVMPLVAQNLASKNNEIQDLALNIIDVFIEYLDGGMLIQPFANLAQHGNARIRPQIINKLADLIPRVYSRKQKQIDLHVLPTVWILLNAIKGNSSSNSGSALNASVTRLVHSLYEQMGESLIERAANNSNVSARNLELLRDLCSRPLY